MVNYHLVVLIHGLWGQSSHTDYIKNQLDLLNKENENLTGKNEKLLILQPKINEGYKTYDGIDLCGLRVALNIFKLTNDVNLNKNDDKIEKISIISYSLGGLIARYCIGILESKNYFQDIKPINFVTFCTPHVGVLTPGDGISVRAFNWLVPHLLGNSGKQMFLKDKVKFNPVLNGELKEDIPLLLLMSDKNSIFYKSLQNFENKSLYSNIVNDKRTCWWTSGISLINFFENLDLDSNLKLDNNGNIFLENGSIIHLNFINGYTPTVLDVNKPITFKLSIDDISKKKETKNDGNDEKNLENNKMINKLKKLIVEDMPDDNNNKETKEDTDEVKESKNSDEISKLNLIFDFLYRKSKWLIVLFNFGIYLPMWIIWFIIHNIIQSLNSTYRVFKESSDLKQLWMELYCITPSEILEIAQSNSNNSEFDISLGKDIDDTNEEYILNKDILTDNESLNDQDDDQDDDDDDDDDMISISSKVSKTISEKYDDVSKNFEDNLHDQGDEFLESIWDAMTSKSKFKKTNSPTLLEKQENDLNIEKLNENYESTKNETIESNPDIHEISIGNGIVTLQTTIKNLSNYSDLEDKQSEETDANADDKLEDKILSQFKKNLSIEQRKIVRDLNSLNWNKFPIYITKTNATHAAAIVRHENELFVEGKVVIKHFINEVFMN
ncbi:hypothetical protein B5S33_g4560 [[Candida] boidinii]|nr:hypothetical protein B5S33_g4560 [[Candida] boidinii]